MKGQVRTNPPEFLENELVIATLDGYGRLQTTASISAESGLAKESSLAKITANLGAWTDQAPLTVPAYPSAAQQLPNYPCSELKVIADRANTQPIYFGGAGVDPSKSQDLEAGDVEIVARISNANEFYVIAGATHTGQILRIQTR